MPWTPGPGFGFTTSDTTWLPFGGRSDADTVAVQRGESGSVLHRYRALLAAREMLTDMVGTPFEWIDSAPSVVAFRRGSVVFAANVSDHPTEMPVAGEVVFRTGDGKPPERLGADEAVIVSA